MTPCLLQAMTLSSTTKAESFNGTSFIVFKPAFMPVKPLFLPVSNSKSTLPAVIPPTGLSWAGTTLAISGRQPKPFAKLTPLLALRSLDRMSMALGLPLNSKARYFPTTTCILRYPCSQMATVSVSMQNRIMLNGVSQTLVPSLA